MYLVKLREKIVYNTVKKKNKLPTKPKEKFVVFSDIKDYIFYWRIQFNLINCNEEL